MPRILGLAVLLSLLSGCATGLAGGDKVMKFHADDEPVLGKVHHAGEYVVVYRQQGSGELWQAHGSRRTLKKGDDLGFTRDETGKLVAIAGGEERTPGHIPVIAQYAAWDRLPDHYDAKRQLPKDLRSAPSAVTQAAVVGGVLF